MIRLGITFLLLSASLWAQSVTPGGTGGGSGSGCGTAIANAVCVTDGSSVAGFATTLPTSITYPAAASITVGAGAPSLTPGTGAALAFSEGTNPTVGPNVGVDVFSFNSTQHGLLANFNNAGYFPVVQGPTSATSGHVATFNGTNGGLLQDGGVLPTVTGGTCTNQAVTAISGSAVPTCTTITSAYVNTSIALTGTDINTSNQVTATHLAAPLPSSQGGTGIANTATLTLGSSNQNWASLATGIVKNTTTTGALSAAASTDVVGLFSGGAGCTGTNYLAANGTCQTSGGGATTALDNLASVNINSALLFQTGIDIGSATKPFRNLYLYGSGTYGTNYTEFTGTPTSTRIITVPDATDTLALLGATQTFTGINTISTSGAASTPAFNFTGAWYAAGSTTTNTPLLNIQQSGASAATGWGANGTAVGVICTNGNPNALDIHQSAGNSLASIKCTGASSFASVFVSGGITNTSADIVQAAANSYTWSGRDKLGSPADGTLSITNNAGTGFTRVTLGPNASTSFIGLGVTTQANPILLLRDANGGNTATLDAGLGISFATVAGGLSLHAGSNARVGSGTLSGGTVAISNTSVTANSKVFVVDTSSGSLANVGSLVVVSKTASTGFTVTSTNVLDASTFDYFIIETN